MLSSATDIRRGEIALVAGVHGLPDIDLELAREFGRAVAHTAEDASRIIDLEETVALLGDVCLFAYVSDDRDLLLTAADTAIKLSQRTRTPSPGPRDSELDTARAKAGMIRASFLAKNTFKTKRIYERIIKKRILGLSTVAALCSDPRDSVGLLCELATVSLMNETEVHGGFFVRTSALFDCPNFGIVQNGRSLRIGTDVIGVSAMHQQPSTFLQVKRSPEKPTEVRGKITEPLPYAPHITPVVWSELLERDDHILSVFSKIARKPYREFSNYAKKVREITEDADRSKGEKHSAKNLRSSRDSHNVPQTMRYLHIA